MTFDMSLYWKSLDVSKEYAKLKQTSKFNYIEQNLAEYIKKYLILIWQITNLILCRHYEIPFYPKIPGADNFKGEIIHSHNYRHPEKFSGKNVVCLGAASSGQDIAIDVATCAKHVSKI